MSPSAGTRASGRSSYTGASGAPRPAATTATAPSSSTTRMAKNHIMASRPRRVGPVLRAGLDHQAHGHVDVVGQGEPVEVGRGDLALGEHGVAQPVEQALPVRRADEHNRERRDLAGLRERECLEQLVEGAEPAGQHDEALGVLDEHGLAREEVAEVDALVDPAVQPGLEGQLDAEPDAETAGLAGTLVGRLHRARAAAGDDGDSRPRTSLRPSSSAWAYDGWSSGVRAEPKTPIAGPISASDPKPSTNSAWMRRTRHGSVCSQLAEPRSSNSRWSVVLPSTWSRRKHLRAAVLLPAGVLTVRAHASVPVSQARIRRSHSRSWATGTCSSLWWANIGSPGP